MVRWGEEARLLRLLGDQRGFLARCVEANREYVAEVLPVRHVEALGVAYVRGAAIDGLQAIPGGGLALLERLRRAGLLRMGDIVDADLLQRVPGLGWKKARTIEKHARGQLADAAARAETWRPHQAVPFPRHPEVESAFKTHRHALDVRNHLLERDQVEHARIERQVGMAGKVGRRAWLGEAPDPTRFAEQRLQFVTLQMARSAGRPPPDVRIARGPEPGVVRRGRALLVHRDVAATLDERQLYALVAHALHDGRSPVPWLGPWRRLVFAALGALGATWSRVGRRVVVLDDRVYRVPRVGLTSLLLLLATLPLAVLVLPLLLVDAALRALGGVWVRPWVFRADRRAVAMVKASEHLVEGMCGVDALTEPDAAGRIVQTAERPGDRPRWRLATPAVAARLWWVRRVRRWGLGEPSTAARTRALAHPATIAVDVGWSLAQLALVVGLVLFGFGHVPDVDLPSWPELATRVGVATEPAEAAEAASLEVTSKRGCHLRAGPTTDARSSGVAASGAVCEEAGPARGHWKRVRCGPLEGYMHTSCLE